MATIKKYNDGTVFYNAFGDKVSETAIEAGWMGDSFNRDALMCYATADCATSTDSTEYTIINGKGTYTTSLTSSDLINESVFIKGVSDKMSVDIDPLRTAIDELQIRCDMLQAKIDAAKERATSTTKLRPALKTLQYKSEVE